MNRRWEGGGGGAGLAGPGSAGPSAPPQLVQLVRHPLQLGLDGSQALQLLVLQHKPGRVSGRRRAALTHPPELQRALPGADGHSLVLPHPFSLRLSLWTHKCAQDRLLLP